MNNSANSTDGLLAPALEVRVGHFIERLAKYLALLGGLVLVLIVILTVLSISGRAMVPLGLGPIPGDFELVEAGTAFAIFSFLPWCQFQRGHVTVDLVVEFFGKRAMRLCHLVGNILMAAIATIIFWRLVLGTIDKHQYQETSFILQFPIWWPYLAACSGSLVFCLVSYYTIWRSANELTGGGDVQSSPLAH